VTYRAIAQFDLDSNEAVSRIVAGKYRLLSVLGRGGMATVWRAQHLQLGAAVAVKLIDAKPAGRTEAFRRCRNEARAAAAIRSPHVVQVLDFGMDQATGRPFIVMEALEGESLRDRLARRGRLSLAETCRIVTEVARALGRAHDAGIVHGDLKPANVFLVHNDGDEIAKVLDFGSARLRTPDALGALAATTGGMIGSPCYMSPEHIGGEPVDQRTDLWALAVVAFECMTGRRPFYASDIGKLVLQICVHPIPTPSQVATVPAAFDHWFSGAARREVDRRFQSAREMADALRGAYLETNRARVLD
jgi:eukaryotic-like serine/threonine-protein kinase